MEKSNIRIVFMGTPEYAVPTLRALAAEGYDVAAVFCQPDKASGRGKTVSKVPVKVAAEELGIAVYQPKKLHDPENYRILREIAPDFYVVIAYGKILRAECLGIPKIASLNLHASILPAYRGAAPIQWALINGEKTTGVSLMRMDEGMDTGPVYAESVIDIAENDNSETLHAKLSALSAELIVRHLPDIAQHRLPAKPQPTSGVSMASTIEKQAGLVDFNLDAFRIVNLFRGLTPWPSLFSFHKGKRIVFTDIVADCARGEGENGAIYNIDDGIAVNCEHGSLIVRKLKPEGKNEMDARSFVNGYRPQIGDIFEAPPSSRTT